VRADRLRTAVVLSAAGLLLGGCSSDGPADAPSSAAEAPAAGSAADPSGGLPSTYVALGDSFTAAPYVPVTELAGGCFRSSGNYPRLVAEEIGADLVDVSCGGARTDDLVDRQSFAFTENTLPPQLKAVTEDAELVTVGIGGNDSDLFNTLVHECTRVSDRPGTSCEDLVTTRQGEVEESVAHIGRQVTRSLRLVQERAPDATVVLVGYPRLVDERSGCPRIPLTDADRRFLGQVESGLRDALAAAARRTGVEFVDMYAASRGHEICSGDPWVNGIRTDEDRALAFHPFAEGQRAVAERIVEILR
jgi:lysophospholipase L1-like esterase